MAYCIGKLAFFFPRGCFSTGSVPWSGSPRGHTNIYDGTVQQMIWEWCGSGRKQGLLCWQSCTLRRIPNCSLWKKGKVVGWRIWERELKHVHSSPEIKTQLQMPNGAITGGEDQLAQPFQIMQSADREIFSISSIPKPHLEGAGKQKVQTADQNSCESSGSACRWVLRCLVICKTCGEILWENITHKLFITIFLLSGAACSSLLCLAQQPGRALMGRWSVAPCCTSCSCAPCLLSPHTWASLALA